MTLEDKIKEYDEWAKTIRDEYYNLSLDRIDEFQYDIEEKILELKQFLEGKKESSSFYLELDSRLGYLEDSLSSIQYNSDDEIEECVEVAKEILECI